MGMNIYGNSLHTTLHNHSQFTMSGRRVLREPPLSTRALPPQHSPSLHHLEDRIAIQHSDIQSLLQDNQRLAATHVALKQELSLAEQELRHLSSVAASVKAERDAEVRELYEKSLKLDAELRVIESMHAELDRVRADIEKLCVIKQEMIKDLNEINGDLAKARDESKDMAAIKAEIETERQEIHKGRAAIECEKKNRASNHEQREIMEKNIISVAQQIERLQAELANAEKRARAAAAAAAVNPSTSYAASYGNPDPGFGGSLYADPYSMHQVQGSAEHGHQ
ncbi:protein flc expressor [Citrus sinensis]|nr:protein FLX-like 1 isoform X3 [Citrus sinensis]XP_052288838.1 protein FLX-like 1 isoform X3 [Citrus sinensis]XP_052288839.1 protein FLX-like 1 isoform X3 [Citrus sinensis]KAH9662064.1 protein flc expressor [Citrus sinensis]